MQNLKAGITQDEPLHNHLHCSYGPKRAVYLVYLAK